jgi:bifunctional DNase/RNase
MRVRYVRRHVPSGGEVAVLGPTAGAGAEAGTSGADTRPMIALSVSRPEAAELAEELDGKPTPRSGVYDLMVNILGAAGASVTTIEVLEAPGQAAQARLQLGGPRGTSEIQVEVGQAISLSVRIGKSLQVSEALIQGVTRPCTMTGPTEDPSAKDPSREDQSLAHAPAEGLSHDVPEQFRRAFDDDR